MPDRAAGTEPSLADIISNPPDDHPAETPNDLRWAAKSLLSVLNTDPAWASVEATLRQMASENTVGTILDRQRAAMAGILNSLTPSDRPPERLPGSPSAQEMQEAEADLRKQLPEIASKLSEVQAAADEIVADVERLGAIRRISAIANKVGASKLSPLALLVVLWWVLGMASPDEIAAVAVWYAVARDIYRREKD